MLEDGCGDIVEVEQRGMEKYTSYRKSGATGFAPLHKEHFSSMFTDVCMVPRARLLRKSIPLASGTMVQRSRRVRQTSSNISSMSLQRLLLERVWTR